MLVELLLAETSDLTERTVVGFANEYRRLHGSARIAVASTAASKERGASQRERSRQP